MQQNLIENEFNREYAPLEPIQHGGVTIEFTVKGANDLYLDLNNSRLHVIVKITKADGTNQTFAMYWIFMYYVFHVSGS